MQSRILLRFGDLVLKGKNKPTFIKQVKKLLKEKLNHLNVEFDFQHDRIYVIPQLDNLDLVIKHLHYVSGISSYSLVYKTNANIDDIAVLAITLIKKEVKLPTTFKVETKRADKAFNYTSQEISKLVAPIVLKAFDHQLIVDVKTPQNTLQIELRTDGAYLYLSSHKTMGGFPVGIGGKGLVMLSGGIDSPVSAYLAIKQGISVELLHFESTSLTPLESVQKVIDLAKIIARYMPNSIVKLHLVPFLDIHQAILAKVDDAYIITIMRRIMYKLAQAYANQKDILCLINGESVGQVASQTLQSMMVVEETTTIPILRPVITYDKQDIINLAKQIETFDISIRAFNDCCSIYVPKNPATAPKLKECFFQESKLEVDSLVLSAISQINTLTITPHTNFSIADFGFDVNEAITNYKENNHD